MSIKIIKIEMLRENNEELDTLIDSVEENLSYFKDSHPDFSFTIDKYPDSNKIMIKTCVLNESCN